MPAGHARTSFIDTRDIGATAAVVLRDPAYIGQKLDITGAQALTYADAAQIMTMELGVPIAYSKPRFVAFSQGHAATRATEELCQCHADALLDHPVR